MTKEIDRKGWWQMIGLALLFVIGIMLIIAAILALIFGIYSVAWFTFNGHWPWQ